MTNRRTFLASTASVVAALSVPDVAWGIVGRWGWEAPELVIRKNPGCMCCNRWADHLIAHGIPARVEEHPDLGAYKDELGIPEDLRSCHTGTIDDYLVEGHVPAEDVLRVLETRPEVRGISVPEMPVGSPGMESGDRIDPYEVIAFGGPDGTYVFATYG